MDISCRQAELLAEENTKKDFLNSENPLLICLLLRILKHQMNLSGMIYLTKRDLYDGVFRKGYLEPYSTSLTKGFGVPKKKFHDDHDRGWTADGAKLTDAPGIHMVE